MKYFDFDMEPGKQKNKVLSINDGKPLISIITAYYNSAQYIRQTANSVFNQTFPYWEWIIVDDGSTDDIDEIINHADEKMYSEKRSIKRDLKVIRAQ